MAAGSKFGARIAAEVRAEMAYQGRTTRGLAAALGVGIRPAQKRLSGDTNFLLSELPVVAEWLGVPLEQLVLRRQDAEQVAS